MKTGLFEYSDGLLPIARDVLKTVGIGANRDVFSAEIVIELHDFRCGIGDADCVAPAGGVDLDAETALDDGLEDLGNLRFVTREVICAHDIEGIPLREVEVSDDVDVRCLHHLEDFLEIGVVYFLFALAFLVSAKSPGV